MMRIEKAAVLGAGTMGAQIAAHLANAGVPTLLLDIAPRELTPEEQAKGLKLDSPLRAIRLRSLRRTPLHSLPSVTSTTISRNSKIAI
jgi:3-hydroxyacyl-CoA dehydrogenase